MPFKWNHIPFECGFKISVFIEDIISGQERFRNNGFDLLFMQQPCGVEEILPLWPGISGRGANDDANMCGMHPDLIDCSLASEDEILEFQKVSRRIATYTQLCEDGKIRPLLLSTLQRLDDASGVRLEVTDMIILLSKVDFHASKFGNPTDYTAYDPQSIREV